MTSKKEKQRRKKLVYEANHPNSRFCGAWQTDKNFYGPVVRTFISYGKYDFYKQTPQDYNVYICLKCGKEFMDEPAMA